MQKVINIQHIYLPSQEVLHAETTIPHAIAVLTQDVTGQSAVYVGIVQMLKVDDPNYDERVERNAEWVVTCGLKQSYASALHYFYGLQACKYRH